MSSQKEDRTAVISGQSEEHAAEKSRLLRSAGAVAAITLLSRTTGYARDIVSSSIFGTSIYADAFVAAFRLPNILRRLVGEGNVAAAFVPVFEHESAERSEEELWKLADSFHFVLAIAAGLLTFAGIIAAPVLVRRVLMPGNPEAWELTTNLVRVTFPYLLGIAMASCLMAVLNARDRFVAAAATPIIYNLTLVSSVFVMVRVEMPIYVWAAAAVIGGYLQWLWLVRPVWKMGMRFWPRASLADPALRRIGALMIPGLFGVGITQFNNLVGQYLASYLERGSIASLFYAGRITELPLGVFAIAIATVVLPLMSRQARRGDHAALVETLNFSIRQIAFITLPAAVGLIVLRTEIVSVLFQRGQFGVDSTEKTAAALGAMALGLLGFAGIRVVVPGFYAMRDTRMPVLIAAVAMVVNLIGCLVLPQYLAHVGIALANSIAAYVNVGLLLFVLHLRFGGLQGKHLLVSLTRIAVASGVMGWVIWGVRSQWFEGPGGSSLVRAGALAATIVVGVLTYLAAVSVMRAPELRELRAMRNRGGP